jgi:hypothetical protein
MTKSQKLTMAVVAGALLGIGGTLAIHGQKVATPPGYVIAEVEVTDPAAMKQYGGKVAETLAPFQHRYVVRSGKFQALEGEAPKGGLVMPPQRDNGPRRQRSNSTASKKRGSGTIRPPMPPFGRSGNERRRAGSISSKANRDNDYCRKSSRGMRCGRERLVV